MTYRCVMTGYPSLPQCPAPEATQSRLYLETMEEVLPGKKKLILDTRAGRRQLMLLRDGIALPSGLSPLPQ